MAIEDICLCASIKCPRYSECLRGDGYKHPDGIYTVSELSSVCNQNNNYKEFIKVENEKR